MWSFALLPCPGCYTRPAGVDGACRRCWLAVDAEATRRSARRPAGAGPDGALVALGPYRGRLGRLVRSAKYRPSAALLDALGSRLGASVRDRWPGDRGWLVVAVPPDARRRRRRGVDHAARLAAAVARVLDPQRPAVAALLRRRSTAPQSRVVRAAREANLRGAIAARPSALPQVAGATVLLVDDVSTSGATLRACRSALLEAGARSVRAAVVARAR